MGTTEKMMLLRDINEILANIDYLVDSEEEMDQIIDSLIGMKEKIIGRKNKISA